MTAPSREEVEALIERLRDRADPYPYEDYADSLCRQSADALTALLARLAEVEQALEPFAREAEKLEHASILDFEEQGIYLELEDFRRARVALQHKDQQG